MKSQSVLHFFASLSLTFLHGLSFSHAYFDIKIKLMHASPTAKANAFDNLTFSVKIEYLV